MTQEEVQSKSYSELTYLWKLIHDELIKRDSAEPVINADSLTGAYKEDFKPQSFTERLMSRLKRKA